MIKNVYEDKLRADSYAALEFPGTYFLAYRDIPEIVKKHVNGYNAIDFGCGAGRSTRFLNKIGFQTTGIDISKDMISKAFDIDPEGDYKVVENANFTCLKNNAYDLVLSMFTFDNIPTIESKIANLESIKRLLKPGGRFINLVSSPKLYKNEWVSFSTKDFPENKIANCGDVVKVIMNDVDDKRPVLDVVCSHEKYMKLFEQSEFELDAVYKPLGRFYEPIQWINETKIAPWVIYVLKV